MCSVWSEAGRGREHFRDGGSGALHIPVAESFINERLRHIRVEILGLDDRFEFIDDRFEFILLSGAN